VVGMTFDHTSILKLIEWRFGLDPLTARDASRDVQNLARALKLGHPDARVPVLPAPEEPPPTPCLAVGEAEPLAGNAWAGLRDSGLLAGWELPE
jgi:hypothetical protein